MATSDIKNANWTRDELLVALYVYSQIIFKKSNKDNPFIIKYATMLGRTPAALNMKVGNIGSCDKELKEKGIVGLTHPGQATIDLWAEFQTDPNRIAYESEVAVAKLRGQTVEELVGMEIANLPVGRDREALVRQRIGQDFFRRSVLSAYHDHCCVSGVGNSELIEACHIVDWSDDTTNRTNPSNGLCLNAFFHKAYDALLMGITPDGIVKFSDQMMAETTDEEFRAYLQQLQGAKIRAPDKFTPSPDLLDRKYQLFLQR